MGLPVGHWVRIGNARIYTQNFATRESAQRAARSAARTKGPDWYATKPLEWGTGWLVYIHKRN